MNTKWEIHFFWFIVQQSKANYRLASWDFFFPYHLNDARDQLCNIMLFFMCVIIKIKDATRVLDMPKHIYNQLLKLSGEIFNLHTFL